MRHPSKTELAHSDMVVRRLYSGRRGTQRLLLGDTRGASCPINRGPLELQSQAKLSTG
jgi:hypothetical protein